MAASAPRDERTPAGRTQDSTTSTTTHSPTVTTTTSSSTPGNRHTIVTTSGPQNITTNHPTVTTTHRTPPPPPPSNPRAPSASAATQPLERQPSIRIRRQPNEPDASATYRRSAEASWEGGRARSSFEPQRPQSALLNPQNDLEIHRQTPTTPLQTLHEEGSGKTVPQLHQVPPDVPSRSLRRPGFGRQTSAISLRPRGAHGPPAPEYESQMVDMLDVIDPEVSTLTTLNNVQNSLFIPNLGWLYNRQPTYDLSQPSPQTSDDEAQVGVAKGHPEEDHEPAEGRVGDDEDEEPDSARPSAQRLTTTNTISSVLTSMEGDSYAVLPHGTSLPGWSAEDKAALNDHVRHLLHSRRAKFKRSMRGFGHYVQKPVGFLVTLYAFLLTFWGAAWVLFLIGWISVGDRQAYFIEICDQILTALFCVVGIGFAPWRAVDTYHMIYVALYAHRTWRLRKERGLPDLRNHNELPVRSNIHPWEKDEEADPEDEEIVLNPTEQKKLEHHQNKLANSHTFYRPHETTTHEAFSVRLLIAIVVLLDCHSLFQMALGGTTWGIYYKVRPKALTAVILSCSISCNISAGMTISVGDKRSRKKLVVEQMFRQGLTEEALKTVKKERGLKVSGIGSVKKKRDGKNTARDGRVFEDGLAG